MCWPWAHKWRQSTQIMWSSNVKTIDRYCLKCGKTEHKVLPAPTPKQQTFTVQPYKKRR
jgi:hypothetical protein